MISWISVSSSAVLWKKTCINRRNPPVTTGIGVDTNTAPAVPPRTISAAVNCEMSLSLPPSISSPPRMPPSASSKPPHDARSGFARAAGCVDSAAMSVASARAGNRAFERFPAEFDHLPDHFLVALQHHELLPVRHADHRVRRRIDVLDQIRVQDPRDTIF